jgi:surface protein
MIFSNKKPKIISKSETYKTVIYSHVNSNKSNFIIEENWHLLRWLNMIGKKKEMGFGFVRDPAHMKGMYKTLMQSATKLKRTNDDIYEAVALWCSNRAEAEEKYGHISDWDVSCVTDMSYLFHGKLLFNDDISRWNVYNVTNMCGMFSLAHSFNQPIGNWNVSKVTDMSLMFGCAYVFNQPIGNWNVSNVMDMDRMFQGTREFNQHVGDWNVSKVFNMEFMFSNTHAFNQSIDSWDMSKVTNIRGIFFEAIQIELLSNKL